MVPHTPHHTALKLSFTKASERNVKQKRFIFQLVAGREAEQGTALSVAAFSALDSVLDSCSTQVSVHLRNKGVEQRNRVCTPGVRAEGRWVFRLT